MTLILALLTGACGCSSGSAPERGATATRAEAESARVVAPDTAEHGLSLTPVDAAALLARIKAPGARASLVNVWATWCVPCRDEFPALLQVARDYRRRGLRVYLVSADFDSADAKKFLERQNVDFETFFRTGSDMKFINALNPHWTGALPATFVYDSTGTLSRFWEGRADYAQWESAVRVAMHGPAVL